VAEATRRPLPKFSDDDVLDWYVTEAVLVRASQEKEKEDKRREREEFRKGHKKLPELARQGAL
jgi:hypothetical protein